MDERGQAAAPGAGTVLNALATGLGSAFAIDREVTATVTLDGSESLEGRVAEHPEADTSLIERCVELTIEAVDAEVPRGGTVTTEADVPIAAGLKSSSAAANATVLATLSALGVAEDHDPLAATRIGVTAAREAGVTVTGAFDDATASMLGGLTVTDNQTDELLSSARVDWSAAVWTPPERSFSVTADSDRCERVAPIADLIADLALDGRFGTAMTVNGFAFCAALDHSAEPMIEALPEADGVSLSGTGPSYVAVGERGTAERIKDRWAERPGSTWVTETRREGAHVL
jgi:shikimate kinase